MSTARSLAVDGSANATRVERAILVYRACLYYNLGLTAVWLLLIATGAGGAACSQTTGSRSSRSPARSSS